MASRDAGPFELHLMLPGVREELLPVDLTVTAELVGLMAHALVTAFQTEVSLQPKSQF